MTGILFRLASQPFHRWWIEFFLACRGIAYWGQKYCCPCCGWRLRAFTRGNTSFKTRDNGYCPRCNSKARHRRDWLFLKSETNLFQDPIRLLHVSPKYALARKLVNMSNIDFVGVDLETRPLTTDIADITDIPFDENSFDAIICIHVLEHVEQDRQAIAELIRVLKPGGWALVSVPIRMDQETYEDASIVEPAERREAFGEEQHVRIYGHDFQERLMSAGFDVNVHRADQIEVASMQKYGLLPNENTFF